MKRNPWYSKWGNNHIQKILEACPGGCVSIDHMVSKQPSLVLQQDGWYSSLAKIDGNTLYNDNDSEFRFSYFQTSLDLDQIVASNSVLG